MNRRKALKSVLALGAAAPAVALGKPSEHNVSIGIDDYAIREIGNKSFEAMARKWSRNAQ